jgi:pyruvate/2-oxoglutarate dehydrogenase complex dihydrolipoamide dehydrogenase (E3) component
LIKPEARPSSPSVQVILDYDDTINSEKLLVAVGRKPKTDKLGLETDGLKPRRRKISVTCSRSSVRIKIDISFVLSHRYTVK